MKNGLWFLGSSSYVSIGLYEPSAHDNSNKSIGLFFYKGGGYLNLSYPLNQSDKILDFHKALYKRLKNIDSVLLCVVEQDHKYSSGAEYSCGDCKRKTL